MKKLILPFIGCLVLLLACNPIPPVKPKAGSGPLLQSLKMYNSGNETPSHSFFLAYTTDSLLSRITVVFGSNSSNSYFYNVKYPTKNKIRYTKPSLEFDNYVIRNGIRIDQILFKYPSMYGGPLINTDTAKFKYNNIGNIISITGGEFFMGDYSGLQYAGNELITSINGQSVNYLETIEDSSIVNTNLFNNLILHYSGFCRTPHFDDLMVMDGAISLTGKKSPRLISRIGDSGNYFTYVRDVEGKIIRRNNHSSSGEITSYYVFEYI